MRQTFLSFLPLSAFNSDKLGSISSTCLCTAYMLWRSQSAKSCLTWLSFLHFRNLLAYKLCVSKLMKLTRGRDRGRRRPAHSRKLTPSWRHNKNVVVVIRLNRWKEKRKILVFTFIPFSLLSHFGKIKQSTLWKGDLFIAESNNNVLLILCCK